MVPTEQTKRAFAESSIHDLRLDRRAPSDYGITYTDSLPSKLKASGLHRNNREHHTFGNQRIDTDPSQHSSQDGGVVVSHVNMYPSEADKTVALSKDRTTSEGRVAIIDNQQLE